MAARITRKTVETVFARYVTEALDGCVATSYNDVGAYRLDYNSVYGGYAIERISNEQGGVSMPLGHTRFTASVFYEILHFGLNTARTMREAG